MPTPNTDANEQTILQCLRMYALSQTVREASDYLMAHPKDRALTADVRLAVETITGQSGILGEAGRPAIQTARTLLSNPRLSFSDIQKWGGYNTACDSQ